MKIQDICPHCEKITALEKIQKNEELKVRGEMITVSSEFLHCLECEQDFDDPQSQIDTLDSAYREFRRRHNMLQPEEIKALRKNYDLTQKELSELLSWGEVTLSRYEKGKLQDNAHDAMLHLIQNPMNVLNLIKKNEAIFSFERKNNLIEKISLLSQQQADLETIYQPIIWHNEPSIFNGFQKLDAHKIHSIMLFFCYPEGQFQTKLCKLLYYADSLHYHKYHQSITGLQYVKMPYGPVPNYYERYQTELIEKNFLEIEEKFFNEYVGINLKSLSGPNLSLFSKEEQQTLIEIKKLFTNYTSKKISDLSHQEEGYIKTQDRAFISYEYAKSLKILKIISSQML